jgi:hypothetical protein
VPGLDWIAVGFLRPTLLYKHDIGGVYTRSDGLLRILVDARTLTDGELRDACAARRDRASDRDRPIRNIAYVFVDEQAARARLEALSPRAVLARGYSLVTLVDGTVVRRAAQLRTGDAIAVEFAEGRAAAQVTRTEG